MLRELLNFQRINWWVLVGAFGINFFVSVMSALLGAYLASNESTGAWYGQYGQPVMLIAVFVVCLLIGFVISRVSDDVPVKHALLGGFGAAVPYISMGIMSLSVMMFMLGVVALAGNVNGAILGLPRHGSSRS